MTEEWITSKIKTFGIRDFYGEIQGELIVVIGQLTIVDRDTVTGYFRAYQKKVAFEEW